MLQYVPNNVSPRTREGVALGTHRKERVKDVA